MHFFFNNHIKQVTSIFIFLCLSTTLYNQNSLKIETHSKKKEVLYLKYDTKLGLTYFIDDNVVDHSRPINVKSNSMNIFMSWVNPLRYSLSLENSILNDERDVAINSFISLLLSQFSLGSNNRDKGDEEEKIESNPGIMSNMDSKDNSSKSFNDPNLALMDLTYNVNTSDTTKTTKQFLYDNASLKNALLKLDDLNRYDFHTKSIELFKSLYQIEKIEQCREQVSSLESELALLKAKLLEIERSNTALQDLLFINQSIQDFRLQNLTQYCNAVLKSYKSRSQKKAQINRQIVDKIDGFLETLKNSIENTSSNELSKDYVKLGAIEFDHGKTIKSSIQISERKFNADRLELTHDTLVYKGTIHFRRHESIKIDIGTGLFFGSTEMKSYGIANTGNDFSVTENTVERSTAVAALFLNFRLSESRYLAPIFQLGIDPTKRRPFLLAGTGISIPSSNFSLTGGPIWTWQQALDKLEIGSVIHNTGDLDSDIKYNFDIEPKGWYLGLTYSL